MISLSDEDIQEIVDEISEKLVEMKDETLDQYIALGGSRPSIESLHGVIGGKNNTYVNAVTEQFFNFRDFLGRWLAGLINSTQKRDQSDIRQYGRRYQSTASHRLLRILKDEILQKYTFLFLERNFYKNYRERTRSKPSSELWQLWFGGNTMNWGLFIAPALRQGIWTNDKSEIRRASYHYWTIGHVLDEGLLVPDEESPHIFSNLRAFTDFYKNVLKRVSNSIYEKEIATLYIDYLNKSDDVESEPFLIPELRYAGLNNKHKYRLDYTVMNSHVMRCVGFEFSPASTHMKISGAKKKKQADLNAELLKHWEDEMDKRNSYFNKFGISIITFTDKNLKCIDKCFKKIEDELSERQDNKPKLKDELDKVLNYSFESE